MVDMVVDGLLAVGPVNRCDSAIDRADPDSAGSRRGLGGRRSVSRRRAACLWALFCLSLAAQAAAQSPMRITRSQNEVGTSRVEGSNLIFEVGRQSGTSGVTVNVTVSESAGSDFVAAANEGARTVTIPDGSSSTTFTVVTVDDSVVEADGTVTVTLTTGTGYTVGTPSSASWTVTDNDFGISGIAFVGAPATTQNNTYKAGDTVRARVTFSESVDVVGSPVLKLLFAAGTEKDMTYDTSGTQMGKTTLDFTYTVAAGDASEGLGFAANKLSLPMGVTIRRAGATVGATLTHTAVAASTDHKVDGVAPTFVSATVDGQTLKMTFNESVTAASSSLFTVSATLDGTTTTHTGSATAVATIAGLVATVTLTSEVPQGATATLAYGRLSSSALRDGAGNEVVGFSGKPVTNLRGHTSPEFDDGDAVTFAIAENNADAATVGTVDATDGDGDTLTWSLASGGDNASFTIGGTTGEIKVKTGTTLDREAKASYTITARVTDGEDADGNQEATATIDDTITVTVNVTNVPEPPARMTAPTVSATSPTQLTVSWTAPSETGAKAITGYIMRHFAGTADPADETKWTISSLFDATETEATLDGLVPDTTYRVQVTALGDGSSPWSPSGQQKTPVSKVSRVAFVTTAGTYKVGDHVEARVTFDSTVELTGGLTLKLQLATGTERDMTLFPTDQSGNRTSYDFRYTVVAGDASEGLGFGANKLALATATSKLVTAGTTVSAALTHPAVAASASRKVDGVLPTFSSATVEQSTLTVTFTEAMKTSGTKPASSVFTVTASSGGVDTTINGGTSAVTISGSTVTAELASSVDIGATLTVAYAVPSANPLADAVGNPAAAFSGKAATNSPGDTSPEFDDGDEVTFMIAENNADAATVGTVGATDLDGDTLIWELDSGDDIDSFRVDPLTGEITVAPNTTFDFETKTEYTITVGVTDREDADGMMEAAPTTDDTIEVTVNVTNVEEPPAAPGGLVVSGTSTSILTVTWDPPAHTGAKAITDYDVRYFAGTSDPADEADWIEEGETNGHNHVGTVTTARIRNLTPFTSYRVQVRAESDGEGPWTASGGAKTLRATVSGIAFASTPAAHQNKAYKVGDTVWARVSFDFPVNVTGSPVLKLLLGGSTERDMTYNASGTQTRKMALDFSYTVTTGDLSAGLGFAANKLSVPAGVTIKSGDSAVDAALTHAAVAADSNQKVDGVLPTYSSATLSQSRLVVTFSEPMNESVTAGTSSMFTVTLTADSTVVTGADSAVTVSGRAVTATLSSPVAPSAAVTLAYVVPSSSPLVDTAGNAVAAFSGKALTAFAHTAPVFAAGDDTTFMIAENNADEASVGTAVATDADGDTLTWSLAIGGDNDTFTIVGTTGEIKVAAGTTLDHETKDSYTITAQVTDGEDASGGPETTATIDDTIEVTVDVTNVEEPPAAPNQPSASAASATSLTVAWTPGAAGAREITDYDVRYREGHHSGGQWLEEGAPGGHTHTGTETSTTIENLTPGRRYHFQVRAEGDGESPWSGIGTATTTLPHVSSVLLQGAPPADQNGSYDVADIVRARVTFDDDVDVTGSPVLRLLLAPGVERDMTFDTSGSLTATRTLDFAYTVADGDVSRSGVGFPADALSTGSGGAIRAAGTTTEADLKSPAVPANADHRVNSSAPPPPPPPGGGGGPAPPSEPPLAEEPRADGREVTLTFERTLDRTSVPDPSDFTVTVTPAASSAASATGPEAVEAAQTEEYRVTAVSIRGATLRLTISPPIPAGASVSVSYTKGARPLRISDGSPTPTFSDVPNFEEEVTNDTPPGGGEPEPEPTDGSPTAEAGEDLEADPGERVELDGSGSSDPNGDELTFRWTQTGGEEVTLDGADTERPSFIAPDAPGALNFSLVVNDGNTDSEPDEVTVSV
ncbi:MAG: hypothetical protein F4X04_01655, partial [Holophagales bacterium]|nr:hypothetical protein [Holophagales bacterium]